MDDRWPGSPPTPPEQPAGDPGVPAADQRPALPPYLPPPLPRVTEQPAEPIGQPPAEPTAGPVAEPGWAWRTSRPAPAEQSPEPSYPAYDGQRYDGQRYDHPQVDQPRYENQPYQRQQYADQAYADQAYDSPQPGDPPYGAALGGPDPWRASTTGPSATGARSSRQAAEPLRRPPAEPVDEPTPAARPGLVGSLLWTLGAFLAPLLVYLGWTATLDTTPRPGCVDVAGGPCPGARAQAVTNLLNVLPAVVVALGAALLLALGIRYIAVTWRSYKVAFAASVIGAGVTTLLVGALN